MNPFTLVCILWSAITISVSAYGAIVLDKTFPEWLVCNCRYFNHAAITHEINDFWKSPKTPCVKDPGQKWCEIAAPNSWDPERIEGKPAPASRKVLTSVLEYDYLGGTDYTFKGAYWEVAQQVGDKRSVIWKGECAWPGHLVEQHNLPPGHGAGAGCPDQGQK